MNNDLMENKQSVEPVEIKLKLIEEEEKQNVESLKENKKLQSSSIESVEELNSHIVDSSYLATKNINQNDLKTPQIQSPINVISEGAHTKMLAPKIDVLTNPNHELKKVVPVEKNECSSADSSKSFTLENFRRNQQSILSSQKIISKKPRIFANDIKKRTLKNGLTVVKIINGDIAAKTFYVIELSSGIVSYLEKLETDIIEWCNADISTSYIPKINEMILAKFQDNYYRAICTTIDETKANNFGVFFVDYGNSSTVTDSCIKPLSPKLKADIILQNVYFENMPDTKDITDHVEQVLTDENGFKINVMGSKSADGPYIANICNI